MANTEDRTDKKRAKYEAKAEKARAKADLKAAEARERARVEETRVLAEVGGRGLPRGVGIALERRGGTSQLVVSGLSEEAVDRLVPEITKELLIGAAAERSRLRAGAMRFVREGVVPTIVKVVAGLIVGYLVIRFGLR